MALILGMLSLILNSYYVLMASQQPSVRDSPCHITAEEVGKGAGNKLSLAVVSVCIPGPRFSSEYINASLSNKQLFCDRWGAKCVLPSERLDNDLKYHAKWEKLLYINQTMYTVDVDWVLWMDCDAAFTNMMIDWQLHIPLNTSKLMVVSEDKNGINLGVFLVPNTLQSREFISLMYQKRHYVERMHFKWKDQSALMELMKDDPSIKSRIDVVPQRKLNGFLKDDRNKDGLKWQPYDWIMHQVLCREEPVCTYKFIWTLDGVAGREPDYSASIRWFNNTKEKGDAQKVNLTHPSLLLPKQSICNTTHEDIRNSRKQWYDKPSDTTISLYPIGKKTVGVQIVAHKAKPALLMKTHIGRQALRAKQLINLMKTTNPFPTLNRVMHAEKAPDFDQYLGCDDGNQTLGNTALLVTQNFGSDNLWHALANHHGVWTLLKILNVSPSDVSFILPPENAPFASPPRTISDVLWPLYTEIHHNNLIALRD